MKAHRHTGPAEKVQRLRIAIPPAMLNTVAGMLPGQHHEVALVGARTPSGTFEISEPLPIPRHQKSVHIGERVRSDRVRAGVGSGRRLLALPVAAAIVVVAGLAVYWFWQPIIDFSSSKAADKSEIAGPVPAETSIAVLPFQNLSDDEQFAFVVAGLQNEILSDLSKISGLKVISRTSVMQYRSGTGHNLREIAQSIGARFLIEGTVQRADGHIRVSAQLIDGLTDMHLWGEHYDRELTDVFAIENDVAEQIVSQLKGKLSPEEKAAIEEQRITPPRQKTRNR